MRVLDLFSGIGGFSLGLERAGMQTVAFCEINSFCQRVLAKHWPGVPIHRDVRELKGEHVGPIDVICGGYPCQPFSLAGQRRGKEDDRHLWPEMRRLVDELRPSWVIGENVAGHIGMGLDDVLSDLDSRGYSWRPFVVPACAVGAWHRRERIWIIAHAGGEQHKGGSDALARTFATQLLGNADAEGQPALAIHDEASGLPSVGHADSAGFQIARPKPIGTDGIEGGRGFAPASWWATEPDVGRVAHGVPCRVDRLRGLGNAVVPQVVEIIGRAILAAEAA